MITAALDAIVGHPDVVRAGIDTWDNRARATTFAD
ncbi:hypothetical protein EHYA_02507 [Embleya hyalina]|uniref:Uncharacterized protein n=1 Tax=Embleya hyalina TaxID=516124 RepID=A0A401YJT1_9ACTN|nr:hypothetical protein EHYA_02507 [Embleya hyalina]